MQPADICTIWFTQIWKIDFLKIVPAHLRTFAQLYRRKYARNCFEISTIQWIRFVQLDPRKFAPVKPRSFTQVKPRKFATIQSRKFTQTNRENLHSKTICVFTNQSVHQSNRSNEQKQQTARNCNRAILQTSNRAIFHQSNCAANLHETNQSNLHKLNRANLQ